MAVAAILLAVGMVSPGAMTPPRAFGSADTPLRRMRREHDCESHAIGGNRGISPHEAHIFAEPPVIAMEPESKHAAHSRSDHPGRERELDGNEDSHQEEQSEDDKHN